MYEVFLPHAFGAFGVCLHAPGPDGFLHDAASGAVDSPFEACPNYSLLVAAMPALNAIDQCMVTLPRR